MSFTENNSSLSAPSIDCCTDPIHVVAEKQPVCLMVT